MLLFYSVFSSRYLFSANTVVAGEERHLHTLHIHTSSPNAPAVTAGHSHAQKAEEGMEWSNK